MGMTSLPLQSVTLLAAFLVGAIPVVRIVERLWGFELKRSGSGNIGAGNATRVGGLKAGVTLAVLDGLKGLVPVLVARQMGMPDLMQVLAGLAAVLGNDWPVVRRERGGRGLATSVGVVVGVAPALMIWPAAWAVVGWRIGGGPAGFVGWAALPAYTAAIGAPWQQVVMAGALGLMMIVRRAQGNAGFISHQVVRRVVFDDDDRDTVSPDRPPLSGVGGGVVLLMVFGPLVYIWLFDSFSASVVWTGTLAVLLLGACVTEFAAKWAFGELFREGTQQMGHPVSRRGAFRAAMVATGVARLLPAGGAVTPVAMAWAVGHETQGTSGAAVRATVLNYGGLSAATGLGLVWVGARYPDDSPGVVLPIGLALAVFGLSMIGFSARLGLLTRFVPRRFRARLDPVLVDHAMTVRSWTLLSARVLLEAATLGCTLIAFGVEMKPSQVVAAFGVSQLVGGLPGLPGGLGVTEAGLVGALALFGVPAAVAATPVLTFRIVSYWLPAIGGAMAGGGRFLEARNTRKVPTS